MSAISLKSITGITSITTPAGVDNQLTLHTNNTVERLRITSDGNVGVNTSSVSIAGMSRYLSVSARNVTNGGAAVELVGARTGSDQTLGVINFVNQTSKVAEIRSKYQGSTTLGSLHFQTSGTERFTIDSSGRVLIGTTTEGHTSGDDLTIATSDTTGITLRGGTSGGGRIFFSDGTSGTAEYEGVVGYDHGTNYMYFSTSHVEKLRLSSEGDLSLRATTQNSFLGLKANSNAINFTLGSTTGTYPRAYFYGTGNGQSSAGDIFMGTGVGGEMRLRSGGAIKLQTNSDSSTIDALYVHAAGTVAVNTLSPDTTYKLDVAGAGQFTTSSSNQQNDFNTGQLTVRNNQSAQGAFIDFRADSATGVQGVIAKIGGFNTHGGSGYDGLLTFSTRQNSDNTMRERMRIKSDGYVGISTNNPVNKLHVEGLNTVARFSSSSSYVDIKLQNSNNQLGFLQYNGTELRFFANSGSTPTVYIPNGKFGVNTVPSTTLHVKDASADAIAKIESESGNDARLKLDTSSGSGAEARIDFEEDASIRGFISYTNNAGGTTDDMIFGTATQERFRINSSGSVSIGNNPTVHSDTIFHVEKSSGETNVKFEGNDTMGARLQLHNNKTTGTGLKNQIDFCDAGGQSTSSIQGFNTDQTNNLGELVFATRDAQGTPPEERLRIQANGEVGINVSDPDSYGANGHGYRGLTVQAPAGGYSGITIRSNYAGGGILAFSDGTGSNAELKNIALQADHVNRRLDILVNGSPQVRFTENGFHPNPSDTAATTALDDYEEGSWTPSFYPLSSNIPITYTTREGKYTKIGNVVYWHLKIQVSNITGNRNQSFGISGFPHNITNSQDQASGNFYGETWDGEIPTTLKYFGNVNRGQLYYYADAMKYYSSSMLDINVSSSMLMGSGFYYTH